MNDKKIINVLAIVTTLLLLGGTILLILKSAKADFSAAVEFSSSK
jgi:hypothetical protein